MCWPLPWPYLTTLLTDIYSRILSDLVVMVGPGDVC